jgi:hypothetical protein
LNAQQPDGSWKGHYGNADPRSTLYIAMQLQRSLAVDASGADRERTKLAVDHALAWAQNFVPSIHDSYANALRLQIAVLSRKPIEQDRFVAELENSIHRDREGAYWNVDGSLPFYTWGYASSLETSAVAAQALLTTNLNEEDRKIVDSAIQYLISRQDASGVWYSGQTTVRVLKALLPFAEAQLKAAPSDGTLSIRINDKSLKASDEAILHKNVAILDAPQTLDVTEYVRPGSNVIQFNASSGSVFASAQLSTSFFTPWSRPESSGTRTGKDYGLDFDYHCATEGSVVGKAISCQVTERRFGSAGYGMLLAEIGLPPGAEVDREQLEQLQSDGSISRYEVQPDHITFYTWASSAAGTHFKFSFTPRYAIKSKAAPSVLYDYYNPNERVSLVPQLFDVAAIKPIPAL